MMLNSVITAAGKCNALNILQAAYTRATTPDANGMVMADEVTFRVYKAAIEKMERAALNGNGPNNQVPQPNFFQSQRLVEPGPVSDIARLFASEAPYKK